MNDNMIQDYPDEEILLSDKSEQETAGDLFTFVIGQDRAGERIDRVLADCLPGQSRSYIKKLIKDGCVRLLEPDLPPVDSLPAGQISEDPMSTDQIYAGQTSAGQVSEAPLPTGQIPGRILKPSTPVKGGETVEIFLPVQMLPEILPEDIPLDILYEDDDILVVNKPKGMVVHPAAGHYSGTLVNAVLHHCRDSLSGINGVLRPGIVHRIDMDTTGSIIICKNDSAHRSIAKQLAEHTIVRRYRAIVLGNIREDVLRIEKPIGRDPADRKRMAVRPDGRHAVTYVKVLERFGDYTYIECRLETGRTHQIRVHMAFCRHPLLGDTVYGSRKKTPFATQGQCLHAMILGFVHPVTGQYIETQAPLPDYFETILQKLRNRSVSTGM